MLEPEILKKLVDKTGKSEKTIRNALAKLHQRFSRLSMNQLAQIYAMENGTSVRSKLTPEEKSTLPNFDIEKPITIAKKAPKNGKKRQVKQFIKYETSDSFIRDHISEVNKCYTVRAYTAAFILCRKIIENMLTDIIRKKYPQNTLANIELYFDISRKRTRDFSEILSNLRRHAGDFGAERTLLERILAKADVFKDDANDKAHSWYHIVRRPKELDDAEVKSIIDMISTLDKKIT
jgi:hypothetical protein